MKERSMKYRYKGIEYNSVEQLAKDLHFYGDLIEVNTFHMDLGDWVLLYYRKDKPSRLYVNILEATIYEFGDLEIKDAD